MPKSVSLFTFHFSLILQFTTLKALFPRGSASLSFWSLPALVERGTARRPVMPSLMTAIPSMARVVTNLMASSSKTITHSTAVCFSICSFVSSKHVNLQKGSNFMAFKLLLDFYAYLWFPWKLIHLLQWKGSAFQLFRVISCSWWSLSLYPILLSTTMRTSSWFLSSSSMPQDLLSNSKLSPRNSSWLYFSK